MSSSRAKFVIRAHNGGYYWMLMVRGKSVARSTQTYKTPAHARRAAQAIGNNASDAPISDDG